MLDRIRNHPVALLIGVTLLAYLPSLSGPFLFDDYGVIVNYPGVHSWAEYWHSASHGLRPLLKLTYTLNWTMGLGPIGFHIFNLAVHLANTWLVGLVCETAQNRSTSTSPFRFSTASLIAMALFALHPIQTEAVTYISGRSASLMTLTYIAAVLIYVRGLRYGRWTRWAVISPLLFVASALTKEVALTLPFALLLWELCIEKSGVRVIVKRTAIFWGILATLALASVLHPGYYSLLYDITGARPLDEAFLYQINGVTYLLSRLFAVTRLSVVPGLGDHPPAYSTLFVESLCLVGVTVWAAAGRKKSPFVLFGLLWFFLHTFIPYIFLPRLDVLNEHHMYMANVGLFGAIGFFIQKQLPGSVDFRRIVVPLGTLVVFIFAGATVYRNLDYRSELVFWENTVANSPPNPHAYNNLGVAYVTAKRYREARTAFIRALDLAPGFANPRRNLERLPKEH